MIDILANQGYYHCKCDLCLCFIRSTCPKFYFGDGWTNYKPYEFIHLCICLLVEYVSRFAMIAWYLKQDEILSIILFFISIISVELFHPFSSYTLYKKILYHNFEQCQTILNLRAIKSRMLKNSTKPLNLHTTFDMKDMLFWKHKPED